MEKIIFITGLLLCGFSAGAATISDGFDWPDGGMNSIGSAVGFDWLSSRETGGWGIEGQRVVADMEAEESALYNTALQTISGNGTNFTVSLDVKALRHHTWAGVVFNYQNPTNFYYFRYKGGEPNYQMYRMVDGVSSKLLSNLIVGTFVLDTDYTLTVSSSKAFEFAYEITETSGGIVRASGVAVDWASSFTGGYAGILQTTPGAGQNSFDNFELQGVPSSTAKPDNAFLSASLSVKSRATPPAPDLRVDGRINPLGLDRFPVEVSWTTPVARKGRSPIRGQQQTAYELRMAASPEALSGNGLLLWQSSKIDSSETLHIPLATEFPWKSGTAYYWTVRFWDENGKVSEWAPVARFETGLLDPSAWEGAEWITSDACAASDGFVESWERSALLDRALQKPEVDQESIEKWYGHVLGKLSKARSPVVFQKEFDLGRPVESARLFVSGLGYYHARINGKRVGNHALAPSVSNYDFISRYNVFDVTALLAKGENKLSVMVAPGRLRESPSLHDAELDYRNTPILRALLEVVYADGGRDVVVSDESWQSGIGPVRRAAFWVGEAYDATKPLDLRYPVSTVRNFSPRMRADDLPPHRVVSELEPVSVINPQPGVWVYDFGRMTVGKARVALPAGKEITIRYGELLRKDIKRRLRWAHAPFHEYPAGTDLQNPGIMIAKYRGGAPAYERIPPDKLLLWSFADRVRSGRRSLNYSASFDYTGFRYVEITGLDEPLPAGAVKALEMHNDLPRVGGLKVANPRLQAVADAAALTILLNTQGIYEDNPGAERVGGASNNSALISPHAFYAFDNRSMIRKSLEDAREAAASAGAPITVTVSQRNTLSVRRQIESGKKPEDISITVVDAFFNGKPLLDAIRFYGDYSTSSNALENAAFYFECLLAHGFPKSAKYADHIDYTATRDLPPGPQGQRPTDPAFMEACSILWQGRYFLAAAETANRGDLVQRVEPLLTELRTGLDERFLDSDSMRYAVGKSSSRQGTDVLTLRLGLLPASENHELVEGILADIQKSNGHQTTGSRLTGPLFSLLAENGHMDEALRLTTRTAYPSPYAMLSVTGGTIAEGWGFPDLPAGTSFVQTEGLAASVNWIYESLVGIRPFLDGPGFKRFGLAPIIPASIPSVAFSFDSPRGRIESFWRQSEAGVEWDFTVPPNTVAVVSLPRGTILNWKEGGRPLRGANGVVEIDSRTIECGSGTYRLKTDVLQ